MQIRQDKYKLGQSPIVEITHIGDDVLLNLKLNLNTLPINFAASISGTIFDSSKKPIQNAIIKLMDNNFLPLTHAASDANGKYLINNITSSPSYNMVAVASGKLLNQISSFTLATGENKAIDFTLSTDPNANLGLISGNITDSSTPTANKISGAVVSLYSVVNNVSTLFAITYTDSVGDFVFSELPIGNYTITISALGYLSIQLPTLVQSGKISSVSTKLSTNPNISNGIVSGIITDNLDKPITNADVILYSVDSNNALTPVAFTTTNSSGIYTFISVPLGTYLVKSNQSELINVTNPPPSSNTNAPTTPPTTTTTTPSTAPPITSAIYSGPNIDKFTIAQPATLFPLSYNIANGTFSNGAKLNPSTNFIDFIGGTSDGSSSLDVNVTTAGLYNLAVQYISADVDRPLKININGIDSITVYNLPPTNGWTVDMAQTFTIPVNLNSGNNTIIFHGDGTNYSSSLGTFNLTISPLAGSLSLFSGILDNNATFDPTTGFVTGIGGTNNGNVTVDIHVNQGSQYNLAIQYLAGDGPKNLLVDVNNVNTGTVYNVPQTMDWSIDNASMFNFSVTLNSGTNTVKFYGDGVNSAPDLGTLYFTQVQFSTIINASTASQ